MRCSIAIALLLFASAARAAFPLPSDGQTVNATVYYDESADTYTVEPGVIDSTAAAWGTFANTLNQTGWGVLNIATSNGYDDSVQMHAAGMLEGALTAGRIVEQVANMEAATFDSDYSDFNAAIAWLDQQDAYTAAKVQESPTDPFWNMIGSIRSQLQGLFAGYTVAQQGNPSALPPLTYSNFSMLNAFGDLLDILPAIDPDRRLNWANLTAEQAEAALFKRSACSAMIKVTYDLSEMFTSHSTWFSFSIMNRVYKNYNLQLNSPAVVSKQFTMSSYPGVLASVDDFWQLDSNLVVMETTNSIINMTLYDQVTPLSLLSWQRVRAANALSADGASWCANLARENSGTYNNQYMVVNYNLFTPGQPLVDDTLWVCEQMIGLVESHDVTASLSRGYWPSYNVPAFETVYNLSGYPGLVEQYGVQYSYQLAPRAQIFRRDQTRVVDMPSMKAFMRYNNFTSDPVSKGNPTRAICARADLSKKNPSADGCLDTKVTSVELQSSLSALAQSGPTTYFEPAFNWDPNFSDTAHYGQPDHWDFPFVTMQPAFPQ